MPEIIASKTSSQNHSKTNSCYLVGKLNKILCTHKLKRKEDLAKFEANFNEIFYKFTNQLSPLICANLMCKQTNCISNNVYQIIFEPETHLPNICLKLAVGLQELPVIRGV